MPTPYIRKWVPARLVKPLGNAYKAPSAPQPTHRRYCASVIGCQRRNEVLTDKARPGQAISLACPRIGGCVEPFPTCGLPFQPLRICRSLSVRFIVMCSYCTWKSSGLDLLYLTILPRFLIMSFVNCAFALIDFSIILLTVNDDKTISSSFH